MLGGNASPHGGDDGVDQGQGDADAQGSAAAGRIPPKHVELPRRREANPIS